MIDLHYTDPDLVALYDVFNGWSRDREFYASLAGLEPIRVLDVGCGTGMIARKIAGQGHDVIGLDPAPQMLDFAASAPGGDKVRWDCGRLADHQTDPFDLIYMTGHAFQCMLSDAEISAFFSAVRQRLRPGGRLVFETRNPTVRAWENWMQDHTTVTRQLPDGRQVTEWHELDTVNDETVAFRSIYVFPDKRLVSHSLLRFANADDLRRLSVGAGLQVHAIYGDWDQSPLASDSPEIIMTLGIA